MSEQRRAAPAPKGLRRLGFKGRPLFLARDEQGGSLIEFTICVPVLLLVVTGVYTFGIAINDYMMLVNATDIGSRQLAISRGQTTDPCKTVATTVYNSAPNLAQASLTFSFTLNGTAYTGTTCTAGAANLVQGSSAEVALTYPCSLRVYGTNLAPVCSMKTKTTELVQ